jgi:ribosomal protein L37E
MKKYMRIDAGTGRVKPLEDKDWPANDTSCNECDHALTELEIEKDQCAVCGHPYHDETIG